MNFKKENIIKYIRNFLGYFVIVFGFFTIPAVSIIAGILIMIVGLMITTHFNKLLHRYNLTIKRRYQIILCFVLFFVAIGIGSNNVSTTTVSDNDNTESVIKETKEEVIPSNIKIHFIDTGNSDCSFIQTEDKNMLIDAGDNNDEQRIVNYLSNLGITKIDYLVSTHPDADHAGGLDVVVSNFDIGQSYVSNGSSDSKTYRDFIYSLSTKGLSPAVPLENTAIELDSNTNVKFYNTKATGNGNALSLVTLLESGNHKMLFMGDATEKVEKSILGQLPTKIDVLKVSHHGSKSATCDELLDALTIKYAVIECGENNKYNHPDKEVINRLKDNDIKTFRTDKKGNIIFTTKNSQLDYEFTETTSGNGSAPVTKDPSDEIKKQQEEAQRQAQIAAEQEAQRQAQLEAQRQAEEAARQAAEQQQQAQNEAIVYIAGSGDGTKYHSNPNCSNMKNPVSISISEAQSQGYEACKKCY